MPQGEPTRKRSGGPPASTTREIPDKLYFRIGEVARLCEVPAYVLRFWESEFPQLKPNKGGTGQRLYRRRDVEMALRVKTLLYDEGYTIPGARQAFKAELRATRDPNAGPTPVPPPAATPVGTAQPVAGPVDLSHMESLRSELRELHALLSRPAAGRSTVKAAPQPIRAPRPIAVEPIKTAPTPFPIRPTLTFKPRQPAEPGLFDEFDPPPDNVA